MSAAPAAKSCEKLAPLIDGRMAVIWVKSKVESPPKSALLKSSTVDVELVKVEARKLVTNVSISAAASLSGGSCSNESWICVANSQ